MTNDSRATSARGPRVLHLLPPGAYGGAESVVAALSRGALASGHEAQVATLMPGSEGHGFVSALRDAGVTVHEIRGNRRGYLGEVRAVAALVRRHRVQVVHTHIYRADLVGLLAARWCGVAAVATVHGHTGGPWRNSLYERVDRRLLRWFDAVVCVAESTRTMLLRAGCRPERLHVIVNGAGPAESAPRAAARQALDLPTDGPVAGFVGRLRPEKGPDLFVRAVVAARREGLRAAMVGDGPERDAVERLIRDLGAETRIALHGARPEAGRLMGAFDVLVVSSRTEQTPMVVLEAMAAGVPVVAFGVGGIPHLLERDCGWVARPGDVDALARGIAEAVDNPAEAGRRAAEARRRLGTTFGMERWQDELERVYRAVSRRASA